MTKKKFLGWIANAILLCGFPLFAEDLVQVASGFKDPTQVVFSRRAGMCVVEQRGIITCSGKPYLDLTSTVRSGGEMGLLSMAFAPDFEKSQSSWVYVNYTSGNPLWTNVAAIPVRGSPEPDKKRVILRFAQPFNNHNGGLLPFGPDGSLFIGTGDGGSAGDPYNNAQRRDNYLGKILRIIPTPEGMSSYIIPKDNPFVGKGGLPEIFAFGLRNPWRFSIAPDGLIYAGDVGQDRREEVSVIRPGDNLGWNIMEADICFRPNCSSVGTVTPIHSYGRDEGFSITGGYLYRGRSIRRLKGCYVYGDFGSGVIRAFPVDRGRKTGDVFTVAKLRGNISSFGEDEAGELYVVDYRSGSILKIISQEK